MPSVGPYYRNRDMTAADPEIRGLLPVRGQTWQRIAADADFALSGIAASVPMGGTGWSGAADEVVNGGATVVYVAEVVTVDSARTYVCRVLVESAETKPAGTSVTIEAKIGSDTTGAVPLSVFAYGSVLQELILQVSPAVGIGWTTFNIYITNSGPDKIRVVAIGYEALPLTIDNASVTVDPWTARARAPLILGGGAAEVATLLDARNASLALMRTLIFWCRSRSAPATFTTFANLWTLAQPALAAPRYIGETTRRCAFAAYVSSTLNTGTSEIDVSVTGGGSATVTISNSTTLGVVWGSVLVPVETTASDGRSGGAWSDVTVSCKAGTGTLSVTSFALIDCLYNGVGPTATPTIAGAVATGNVLCCYYWGATSFQWYRAGVTIVGATNQSYTCVVADTPGNLTCVVIAENGSARTSNTL